MNKLFYTKNDVNWALTQSAKIFRTEVLNAYVHIWVLKKHLFENYMLLKTNVAFWPTASSVVPFLLKLKVA